MDEKPADAVRAKPDSSLVARRAAPSRTGEADAVVSRREHRRDARRRPARASAASRASCRPAIAVPIPARARPVRPARRRRERRRRPEHLLQFAHMGAVFAEEILGVAQARRCGCSRSARSRRRATSYARGARAARGRRDLDFGGNAEGRDCSRGAADVVVTDGFTGNVALKLLEGTIRDDARRLARRDRGVDDDGKLGGLLIRPAARRLRDAPRPGHLRRRVPARPARARRDRARQLVAAARSRTRSASRPAASSTTSSAGSLQRLAVSRPRRVYDRRAFRPPNTNEVTWQRRARKSSSGSRKS